jgi:hypothetical protein
MSAEIVVGPILLDFVVLAAAIVEVARHAKAITDATTAAAEAFREVRRLKTSDGEIHEVLGVFTDGVGRNAGVRKAKKGKGYEIVVDSHGLTPEQKDKQQKSVQLVFQRYAYLKLMKELKKEGYAVAKEQAGSDGTIRLVVRKSFKVGNETELESTISPDGAVKMEVKGLKGKACVPEAQKFVEALGDLKSQNLLPEYYEENSNQAADQGKIQKKPGA